MEKRTYDITVGGEALRLRLDRAALRRLKQRHGKNPTQILLDAVDDPELQTLVLGEALRWSGNDNPRELGGEDLCDALVDDGFGGELDWGGLMLKLGEASGLWSKADAPRMLELMTAAHEKGLKSLEEPADGEEAEGAENPPMSKNQT